MARSLPSFAIVVPTHERPEELSACLEALSHLDYPHDRFEVVVVDDGSAELLDELVARYASQISLKLLRQKNAGPASARNLGAASAGAEFLAFIDDDCRPAPDWLRVIANHLIADPERAIGGRTLNSLPNNAYATASQLLISYLYTYYNRNRDEARFVASNNLALPAKLFEKLGGFQTGYRRAAAEDRDFCDRLLLAGYRLAYVPEAIVSHGHRLTLARFCRQHFNYGRGAWTYHCARAQRGQGKVKIEPLSFYLNILRYPFTSHRGAAAVWLAVLLGATQVANAAGFFWQRWLGK
ncbi:MAG: glycosyltransferase [Deltaproteobacteria bacterium]|nr:glycosyltransferase [Deltaproteobacteria bacterium]